VREEQNIEDYVIERAEYQLLRDAAELASWLIYAWALPAHPYKM